MTLVKPNSSKTFPFYLLAEIAEMFSHAFIFSFVYVIIIMLFTYYFNLKSKNIKKTNLVHFYCWNWNPQINTFSKEIEKDS